MGIDPTVNGITTLNDLCLVLFMTSDHQDLNLAALWPTEREMKKLKIENC